MAESSCRLTIVAIAHVVVSLLLLHLTVVHIMPYHLYTPEVGEDGLYSKALPEEHAIHSRWRKWLSFDVEAILHSSRSGADSENFSILWSASVVHFVMAIATYGLLMYVTTAPFGRHSPEVPMRFSLPAGLSWALQEMPTLLNVLYYLTVEYPFLAGVAYRESQRQFTYGELVMEAMAKCQPALLLFVFHYVHRACIYPLLLSPHAHHVPLHVTWCATVYCLLNGRLQLLASLKPFAPPESFGFPWIRPLADTLQPMRRDGLSLSSITACGGAAFAGLLFVGGSMLYFRGMAINIASDYDLIELGRSSPRRVYRIPSGGGRWWRQLSCPNFFGEIVEWIGYALVVGSTSPLASRLGGGGSQANNASSRWQTVVHRMQGEGAASVAAVGFAVYVLANLIPRGCAHHRWYKKKFGPAYDSLGRYAVLPGLC